MRHVHAVLREAVFEKVKVTWPDGSTETIDAEVKPQLIAHVCESCCRAFDMGGADRAGEVYGIFNVVSAQHGNMFAINVCSFKCAEAITSGGWRRIDRYAEFAALGPEVKIDRAECCITEGILLEHDLVARWEDLPPLRPKIHFSRNTSKVEIRHHAVGSVHAGGTYRFGNG